MKAAVLSCKGLGDGLIALVLSNNLRLNGYLVDTFHPFLDELQGWFPGLTLMRPPPLEKIQEVLSSYEHYFIIYEKSTIGQAILSFCLTFFPKKTTVLNPIATTKRDYPYWEQGRFDGQYNFVDNLVRFCRESLQLKITTKSNGLVFPEQIMAHCFPKRIIIHPTSSREGKNWPQEKYLKLGLALKQEGFEPVFALTKEEKKQWDNTSCQILEYSTLHELAQRVAEAGYMIGNDSGIGHLASSCGLPTLTICRNRQTARFWRPAWARGSVITPPSWVPNLKGLRLRDQHWKKWISIERVLKEFEKFTKA